MPALWRGPVSPRDLASPRLPLPVADSATAIMASKQGPISRTTCSDRMKCCRNSVPQIVELAERFENVALPSTDADLAHLRATVRGVHRTGRGTAPSREPLSTISRYGRPEQPRTNVIEIAIAKTLQAQELEERLSALPEKLRILQAQREAALADLTAKARAPEAVDKTEAIRFLDEAKSFFEAAKEGLTEFGRQDSERAINDTFRDLSASPTSSESTADSGFRGSTGA